MLQLGVNIDHVATIRQARYREAGAGHPLAEPDPVRAAREAVEAGAHGITAHLREDRRHIQDADIERLLEEAPAPLNLEMSLAPEIVDLACGWKPVEACLVPESRQEVTTEGGLDVAGQEKRVSEVTGRLAAAGVRVSLFIDPDFRQLEAAVRCGAPIVELHTGAYANALEADEIGRRLAELAGAADHGKKLGLQVNAGHGLNYTNLTPFLKKVKGLHTLNIGHSIVSRAVFTGMRDAVKELLAVMSREKLS